MIIGLKIENQEFGKNELWYFLNTDNNAQIIHGLYQKLILIL